MTREDAHSNELFREFTNHHTQTMNQNGESAREIKRESGSLLTLQQAKFLSEIQVGLDVEIGKLSIPADKLIDLLPGQTFEFEFDPLLEVSLSLGGEKIAKAKFMLDGETLYLEVSSVKTTL